MSQRTRDVILAGLSTLVTSFTFQMRQWTGIRSSIQWPIGASVLVTIVFLVIERRNGIRTTLLLASLIGIGLSLLVACTWLYVKDERQQRKSEEAMKRFDREFEAIRNLVPPTHCMSC